MKKIIWLLLSVILMSCEKEKTPEPDYGSLQYCVKNISSDKSLYINYIINDEESNVDTIFAVLLPGDSIIHNFKTYDYMQEDNFVQWVRMQRSWDNINWTNYYTTYWYLNNKTCLNYK